MRKQYFLLTVAFFYLGYLLKSVYLPYVYQNNIVDSDMTMVASNLILVPCICFFLLLVRNKPILTYFYDILLILGFYIGFELLQIFGFVPGIFDYNEISALLVGGILTAFVSNQVHRLQDDFSVSS